MSLFFACLLSSLFVEYIHFSVLGWRKGSHSDAGMILARMGETLELRDDLESGAASWQVTLGKETTSSSIRLDLSDALCQADLGCFGTF